MIRHSHRAWLPLVAPLLLACAPSAPASKAPPPPAPAAAAASPAAPAPASPAAQTREPDKFVYGIVSYNPFHTVVMVANEKRIMEQYGIDLDILLTNSAPAAVAALMGGAIDMVTTSVEAAFPVQAQSPDVKMLLGVVVGAPYVLFATPDINSLSDLRGKTLGATALKTGPDSVAIRLLLGKVGLVDDRDYSIVVAGPVAERTAAMRSGQIAAVMNYEPQVSVLKAQGFKLLDEARNYPELRDIYSVVTVGRQGNYQAREEVFVRFLKGYLAATRFVNDPANRDEVIDILERLLKVEREYATNTYNVFVGNGLFPAVPRIETEWVTQILRNARLLEIPGVPEHPEGHLDNSLIDRAVRESR